MNISNENSVEKELLFAEAVRRISKRKAEDLSLAEDIAQHLDKEIVELRLLQDDLVKLTKSSQERLNVAIDGQIITYGSHFAEGIFKRATTIMVTSSIVVNLTDRLIDELRKHNVFYSDIKKEVENIHKEKS